MLCCRHSQHAPACRPCMAVSSNWHHSRDLCCDKCCALPASTDLDLVLRTKGVQNIVLTGITTDGACGRIHTTQAWRSAGIAVPRTAPNGCRVSCQTRLPALASAYGCCSSDLATRPHGAAPPVCVHTTMRDANDRGYECLLLSDCCAVSAGSQRCSSRQPVLQRQCSATGLAGTCVIAAGWSVQPWPVQRPAPGALPVGRFTSCVPAASFNVAPLYRPALQATDPSNHAAALHMVKMQGGVFGAGENQEEAGREGREGLMRCGAHVTLCWGR